MCVGLVVIVIVAIAAVVGLAFDNNYEKNSDCSRCESRNNLENNLDKCKDYENSKSNIDEIHDNLFESYNKSFEKAERIGVLRNLEKINYSEKYNELKKFLPISKKKFLINFWLKN